MAKDELSQIKLQLQTYSSQLEEQKQLVQNLRTANKTLREEMRKVQSSVQLMERSRNPGVGYWSASAAAGPSGAATPSPAARSGEATPITPGEKGAPAAETGAKGAGPVSAPNGQNGAVKGNDEEEVNLEVGGSVVPVRTFAQPTVSPKRHSPIPRKPPDAETARSGPSGHPSLHTAGASETECQDHSVVYISL